MFKNLARASVATLAAKLVCPAFAAVSKQGAA